MSDTEMQVEALEEQIRLRAAALKDQGLLSQGDLVGAGLLPVAGNANPYVPWTDANIPYECSCGQIIWADTVHFHLGDQPIDEGGAMPDAATGLTPAAMKFLGMLGDLGSRFSDQEVAEQAFEIWKQVELAGYDTTGMYDEQARYNTRPMTEADAVLYALLRREEKLPDPVYFNEDPVSIWPEAETLVRQKIDAEYDYDEEMERRVALAREDYRRYGDHM